MKNTSTFQLSILRQQNTEASKHVEFVGREIADRNFEPLQKLDERDYEILDTYNQDQIIRILLIDWQFMQIGSSYSPQLLEGMNHAKVKAEFQNAASPVGKAIKTEADNITAFICKSIGGKSDICKIEDVKSFADKI